MLQGSHGFGAKSGAGRAHTLRPARARPVPGGSRTAEVSVSWLKRQLGMPSVRIVDVRASASGGFIPGAVRLDDAAAVGVGVKADPGIAEFAFAMARHGVDNGDFVVVYDRGGDGRAVRLARTLGRFGHTAVAVLSGGFERWLAERGPTDALPVAPRPASFTARRVGG